MARSWLCVICLLVSLLGVGSAGSAAELRGMVSTVAGGSRVIALERAPADTVLVQYDAGTVFRNLQGGGALEEGETVVVDYRVLTDRNLATTITVDLPSLPEAVTLVSRSELEAILRSGNGGKPFLLADVRTPEAFADGHIPGAVSIPYSFLEKRMGEQLPEDKATPLIFYANVASSSLLPKAAVLALKHRFRDVRIYRGGMADWLKSDNLVESTVESLRKGAQGIVDLRSKVVVAAGHIPQATNIPAEELEQGRLPADRNIPLVFYGDRMTDVRSAVAKVRGWGYSKVSYIVDGIESWQELGGTLQHGPAAGTVAYSPVHEGGRIAKEDVPSIISSKKTVMILDVRAASAFSAAHLARAVNIPLESLPMRLKEVNKQLINFVYGADGTAARMAYQFLKGKGYLACYLDGSVEVRKDGTYRVRE